MSTDRYWFIDFDGVINQVRPLSEARIWGDETAGHADGYQILYSPTLVDRINAAAKAGVNVVWLTTWCERTEHFPEWWGFVPLPFIGRAFGGPNWWWKADSLRGFQDDEQIPLDARIVWSDDDLDPSGSAYKEIGGRWTGILPQTPDSSCGLTSDDIAAAYAHLGVGND